jgi:NSS family neurotransmitter:Na+ symporter
MGDPNGSARGQWATKFGFVLAASGSAVGLGNLWKFPYITGEYGGGAFVLVYLLCIALVGLPLMYAEMVIGQRGGKDVLGALRGLLSHCGAAGTVMSYAIGVMAIASGFLILSFYSVVAGWALHFLLLSIAGLPLGEDGAGGAFRALAGNGLLSSGWHTLFMVMTIVVVARGIHSGIELLCKILMPALVGILLVLAVYMGFQGGMGDSVRFLFVPTFSKLSGEAVLEALGHSFFTLSLGMGAMVTYGSYVKQDGNIVREGFWVAVLDTGIALLAGLVIFSVVFKYDLEPSAGPGLLFATLPDLFLQMPGGIIVSVAFFVLVVFAAWSSAVSLLEVVVAYMVDEHGLKRFPTTVAVGASIWLVGLLSAYHGSVLDFLDDITTKYLLPGGGLLIGIAAGWMLSKEDRESGFRGLPSMGSVLAFCWTGVIRFFTPLLVAIVILAKIGWISF